MPYDELDDLDSQKDLREPDDVVEDNADDEEFNEDDYPDRPYLIEDIIPVHTVNILGGPVDSGKTSWILHMLQAFVKGHDVLGKKTHPVPAVYWSADREQEDIQETLKRLRIPKGLFKTYADMGEGTQITDIPNRIPADTQLIVIDAIGMYVAGRLSDYADVGKWFRGVRRMCKTRGYTIIGTHHTAKTKEGDNYSAPSQRFNGSISWGGYADTKLLIEQSRLADIEDPIRDFYVMPKNKPPMKFQFTVSPVDGSIVDGAFLDTQRLILLNAIPAGGFVQLKTILQTADSMKIKKITARRLIDKMVALGELQTARQHKGPYGTYLRVLQGPGGIVMPPIAPSV